MKKYYKENKAEIAERMKSYRQEKKAEIAEKVKKYREQNNTKSTDVPNKKRIIIQKVLKLLLWISSKKFNGDFHFVVYLAKEKCSSEEWKMLPEVSWRN